MHCQPSNKIPDEAEGVRNIHIASFVYERDNVQAIFNSSINGSYEEPESLNDDF